MTKRLRSEPAPCRKPLIPHEELCTLVLERCRTEYVEYWPDSDPAEIQARIGSVLRVFQEERAACLALLRLREGINACLAIDSRLMLFGYYRKKLLDALDGIRAFGEEVLAPVGMFEPSARSAPGLREFFKRHRLPNVREATCLAYDQPVGGRYWGRDARKLAVVSLLAGQPVPKPRTKRPLSVYDVIDGERNAIAVVLAKHDRIEEAGATPWDALLPHATNRIGTGRWPAGLTKSFVSGSSQEKERQTRRSRVQRSAS
jgi:hypothetical protein